MKRFLFALILIVSTAAMHADEGMWMAGRIGKGVGRVMKKRGLELPLNAIYNDREAALTDAVVSFGGFCSGVVVSADGLVFTNHHCGFESIHDISTPERNYMKEGFAARSREEEIPCRGLFVRFLVRTENVTKRMTRRIKEGMSEEAREAVLDSVAWVICNEVEQKDSMLNATVDSYYAGNEFWLSVYRDYNDVRLVFAPPTSVGAFGWNADNWEWPRHTGDFCVFRIYSDKDNQPAEYHPNNRPYHPKKFVPIALNGYQAGDFCMTLGYPGATQRTLSSYGIEEMAECGNTARHEMRTVKLGIMKEAMRTSDSIDVMYAAKYEEDSNYMKFSEEENKAIKQLGIIKTRREREYTLGRDTAAVNILKSLKENYEARRRTKRALAFYEEAFFNGAELPMLGMSIVNGDYVTTDREDDVRDIKKRFASYSPKLDCKIFAAMAEEYKRRVAPEFLPVFYQEADTLFGGDLKAFAESIYANSRFTSLEKTLEATADTAFIPMDDPAANLAMELLFNYFTMNAEIMNENDAIAIGERRLAEITRERIYTAADSYPDANSTMRLSYGRVSGYSPRDGVDYGYYTTTQGILEKVREYGATDPDFRIQPKLAQLLRDSSSYAGYADKSGEMRVCFITDNDITGGNSGSAMLNGRGELLGLAFDGNSEAMSGDILFDKGLQRCIGVDVRYMLYIMEKYAEAKWIVDELVTVSQ
jgi:hypothetical protein